MQIEDVNKFLEEKREGMLKVASANYIQQKSYASPYLSLSDLTLPNRMVDLFKWCKYFYTFDPLIHGAVNALSTFPITRLEYEESDGWMVNNKKKREDKEKDDVIVKQSPMMKSVKYMMKFRIKIYKLLIEIGIDYFLYGNCFVFGEITTNGDKEKEWKSVRRLSPDSIIIDSMPDGTTVYKWNPPESLKRVVKNGEPKSALDRIPEILQRAIRDNKAVVIDSSKIYHFKKPSDSLMGSAWGTPGIANVLKLLMYRNILRQAQEAVAREHIVPFRIYFLNPQGGMMPGQAGGGINAAGQGVASPSSMLAAEIEKASSDPNYKIVSNMPVGMVTAGGQGRNLLLTAEIDQIQSEILAGMNVPREFIFGGVSFSGSSISLKILENHFITYRLLLEDFMNDFIIKGLYKARGEWKTEDDDDKLIRAYLTDLKMQDDIQQKQLVVNLNAAGKVSDGFLLRTFGIDYQKMSSEIKEEARSKSEIERGMMIAQVDTETEMMKAKMVQQAIMQAFGSDFQVFSAQNPDYEMLNSDVEKIISDVRKKVKPRDLELYKFQEQKTEEVDSENANMIAEMAMTVVDGYKTNADHGANLLEVIGSKMSPEDYSILIYKIQEFVHVDPDVDAVEGLRTLVDQVSLMKNIEPFEQMIQRRQNEQAEADILAQTEEMANQEEQKASQRAEAQTGSPAQSEKLQTGQQAQGQQTQGQQTPGTGSDGIDMRSQPSQKPPRRESVK